MATPILTAPAMQEADRRTINAFGIPGFTLMESAARATVEVMVNRYGDPSGKSVLVLAGKGNNGGDGLVVARVLHSRNACVRVITLAKDDDATPDTALNLRLLKTLVDREDTGRLSVEYFESIDQLADIRADLVVDALLGTGLTSALREPVLGIVEWMNRHPAPIAAIDVPTGIDSDTGRVHGTAVRADLTVAMAASKVGLLINNGQACAGQVETVEIGIPKFLLNEAAHQPGCAWQISDDQVAAWLPRRSVDAHKYKVGMVLAVVGSPSFTGAAVMASQAAARIGAGYVICATPKRAQPILAQKLTDISTVALPDTEIGTVSPEAIPVLQNQLSKARAVLVGCGLGRHSKTSTLVRSLLETCTRPGVLDADGLHALVGHTDLLRHTRQPWIVTPHWGEFLRLVDTDEVPDQQDRVRWAGSYAEAWRCVLILKGQPSVVGFPDGRVFINATGNTALATAGTGDVLAGMCAGLLAQGLPPEQAALAALHIGGAVADRYISQYDERSMLATDLITGLPEVLFERFRT